MSLDRYQLRAQLGAGPDGVAYRALAEDGATEVEVRDLSAARRDPARWARLVPRLRMATQLVHPAAIRVLELGLDDDPPYMVTEWVGVMTLAESVRAHGPKSPHEAMELIHTVAGALKAAHRLGLPHGQLGPGHVLLAGPTRAKLDFTGASVGFPGQPEPAPSAPGIAKAGDDR